MKSLEGLQIVGDINSRALQADPKVIPCSSETLLGIQFVALGICVLI